MSTMPSISREHVSGSVCFLDVRGLETTTHTHATVSINLGPSFVGKSATARTRGGLFLNPNAEEFVPSAFRPVGSPDKSSLVSQFSKGFYGEKVLDQPSSIRSDGSEDESRQVRHVQLPEDLTIDFGLNSDNVSESATSQEQPLTFMTDSSANNAAGVIEEGLSEDQRLLCSQRVLLGEETLLSQRSTQYPCWEEAVVEDYPSGLAEEQACNWLSDMQFGILVTEFPNFGQELLADVLFANHGDLVLTMEILTQLELQNGVSEQNLPQVSAASDSLSAMNFPALPASLNSASASCKKDIQLRSRQRDMQSLGTFCCNFDSKETGANFAAVTRKHTQQRAVQEYTKKTPKFPGGLRNPIQNIKCRNAGSPVVEKAAANFDVNWVNNHPWLETGDAVGKMYSDMREEARDHARIRNAYFEQATGAYLIGNKALAKELSAKGQWHNRQMKEAHAKAGDTIFQQRNTPVNALGSQLGHPKILDLHGLHVNEAISFLKRELATLRKNSRTSSKCQQVLICVGTGHHTKGSRTPARLPVAIEHFLLEYEHLQFVETQPGLLQVVL